MKEHDMESKYDVEGKVTLVPYITGVGYGMLLPIAQPLMRGDCAATLCANVRAPTRRQMTLAIRILQLQNAVQQN
jgi:hypothetical protein